MLNRTKSKPLAVLLVVAMLMFSMVPVAMGTGISDVPDNSLKIGNDVYSLDSTNLSDTDKVQASLSTGDQKVYFKTGSKWYDVFAASSDAEIGDPAKALADSVANAWTGLAKWYKGGTEVAEFTTAVTVSTVTATAAGDIAVTLSGAPATTPVAGDFAFTQQIGTAAATTLTVTDFAWAAADNKATFKFTAPAATTAEQSVVISAAYAGSTKAADAFTVAVASPVVTTVEVTAISLVEYTSAAPVVTVKDQNGNAMTTGYTLTYAITAGTSTFSNTTGKVTAPAYSTTAANNLSTLTVTAAPTSGTAVVGTATITVTQDAVKPAIESVQASDSTHIVVTFSETVTGATTATNYSLYSAANGNTASLTPSALAGCVAVTISDVSVAGSGKTTVSIAITSDGGIAGLVAGALTNGNYVLYANTVTPTTGSIADPAGNYLAKNSACAFAGTLSADSSGPVVATASYDNGLMKLTLTFNENATSVDKTKISIVNGTTTVALASTNASTGEGTTSVVYSLTSDQNTQLGILGSTATVSLAAGAVKDDNANNNTAATQTITAVVRPTLTAASYDENTNKVTLTFSKAIKLANFDRSKFDFLYGAADTSLSVTSTNLVVETTGTTSDTVVLAPNEAGIGQFSAQRATSGVTYKVKMTDAAVQDSAGTACQTSAGYQSLSMTYTKETTVPTISTASYTTANKTLSIVFSERMKTTVGNPQNIGIYTKNAAGSATASIGVDAVTTAALCSWSTDGKTATLVLSALSNSAVTASLPYNRFLMVNTGHGFVDINNNALAALTTAAVVIPITYTVNDAVSSVNAATGGLNLINLTFAGLNTPGSTCASTSNFSVYEAGNVNATKTISGVQLLNLNPLTDSISETLAIKLSSNMTSATTYTVAYSNMLTANGTAVTNGTVNVVAAADAIAPTLQTSLLTDVDSSNSVTVGDTVALVFDEPVVAPTSGTLTPASVVGTGNTIVAGDAWNKLTLTIGSSPSLTLATSAGAVAVAGSVLSGTAITTGAAIAYAPKDFTGNYWAASDPINQITYPAAATAPTQTGNITAADVDSNGCLSVGDTITIPFDKTISSTYLTLASIWANLSVSGIVDPTSFSAVASGSNVVLTFTSVAAVDAKNVSGKTINITGSGCSIKSSWGIETGNVTGKAITVDTTVKPYITSASFSSTTRQLYVVFSEPVYVSGSAFDVNNVTLDAIFIVNSGYDLDTTTGSNAVSVAALSSDTTHKIIVLTFASGEYTLDTGLTTLNIIAGGANASGNAIIYDFDGNQPKRADTTGVTITAR